MEIEIYEETINPFDTETAKRFVFNHRNIFNDKTIRKVAYSDRSHIIIEEINYFRNIREVWFWGFSRTKRAIIRKVDNRKTAIEKIRETI